jgi:hypothetical protein
VCPVQVRRDIALFFAGNSSFASSPTLWKALRAENTIVKFIDNNRLQA